jgi:enamine deaminase RidA (YjgF/YER057c/UK114 family)
MNMPTEASGKSSRAVTTQTSAHGARIWRKRSDGMDLFAIEASPVSEFHLTITPQPSESPAAMVRRLAEAIHPFEATVVRLIAFGSVDASKPTLAALRQAFDSLDLPLTWIEGLGCDGAALSGIQLHAVSGAEVHALPFSTHTSARIWRDTTATHCVLSGLGPTHPSAPVTAQAQETFQQLQSCLAHADMTMKNVARTWFYLDDILNWYGEFNRVRNRFFEQCELRPGSVPASTGVRGRNPAGTALTAAAWAVKPHQDSANTVHFVPSPRQCSATSYGSAFSRAVEINSGGYRQLLVSGTASIEPGGMTVHVGDVRKQIELTMQVVGAILESRGLGLGDVSRATAYFKSGADLPVFQSWLKENDLLNLPVVNTCCEICRDDLLFEIEVDAMAAGC